jgi:hypothetical protein
MHDDRPKIFRIQFQQHGCRPNPYLLIIHDRILHSFYNA